MWTKTDTAAHLLRSLEHRLDEYENQNYRNYPTDVQQDLHKLIEVLENPIFKHNLNVQESIRNLREQLKKSKYDIKKDKYEISDFCGESKSQISQFRLAIPNDILDIGWILADQENSVVIKDVVNGSFIERDARIKAGDELLVVDGRPVAGGALSSNDINELLFSKIGLSKSQSISNCNSGVFTKGDSHIGNSTAPYLDKEIKGFYYLDLIVAIHRSANQQLSRNSQLVSDGTTFALTSWRPRANSFIENNMVLHGDWTQIQIVELENDGSGLGFGIVGGRSTGVVVKTILAGGAADRDGRLRPGDHLLQINDVHLHGMSSEQVAMILRQQDQSVVKIIVGRPADTTSPHPSHSSYQESENLAKQLDNRGSFTVPTKVAIDPLLFEQHLQQMAEQGLPENWDAQRRRISEECKANIPGPSSPQQRLSKDDLTLLSSSTFSKENRRPDEYEILEVTLKRDPAAGLGIAVACYVHRKEEIAGLFVRNLLPGSVSDLDGRIRRHDQIVKVNNNDLDEVQSHKEAIRYLADAGDIVQLTLVRYYPSSIKYRFLEMLASQDSEREMVDLHSLGTAGATTSIKGTHNMPVDTEERVIAETARKKWSHLLGEDREVVVAKIPGNAQVDAKGGHHFGIALEGTVDVINGTELQPHHYIRSVSPDSAAASSGRLRAGDELLEANGQDLYGRSYLEVVDILSRFASSDIHLVCARRNERLHTANVYEPSTSLDEQGLARQTRTAQTPSSMSMDRLVKAKSEISLMPNATTGSSSHDSLATDRLLAEVTTKFRSRSLEPLANLAVWSAHPVHIELTKGDRGLGFSVLDYQDPLHPSDTVIVIRSLVPGGVAASDGRLVPGDRLLYVNDVDLTSNASLEKAVAALKNASKGIVRLVIAKSLPLDEQMHSPIISQTERLLAKGSMSSPQPSRKWDSEKQNDREATANGQRYQQQYRSGDIYVDDVLGHPPPLPRLPLPDWTLEARKRLYPEKYAEYEKEERQRLEKYFLHHPRQQQPQHNVRHTSSASAVYGYSCESGAATGRLPQSLTTGALYTGSYLSMSSWSGGSSPSLSPAASPSLLRGGWAADVIHLPSHLEQAIKIKKAGTDPLGVTVEAVDKAINGCLVKSMLRSGAFGKDGRVQIGDFLVRMNNENLRNVTNSQARAILKRTNLLGTTEFNCSYIPGLDADKYKDYVAKQAPPAESPIPNVNRLSPKSPYVPRRQGAQSIGESDASSDADMSYKEGEIPPISPGASSRTGLQQANVDSDSLPRHLPFIHQPLQQVSSYQDTVSSTSSVAFASTTTSVSIPMDYKHYPVSGDQFSPSYYEKRIAENHSMSTQIPVPHPSQETRPRTFSETLPPVAEVSETKLSPEKESEANGVAEPDISKSIEILHPPEEEKLENVENVSLSVTETTMAQESVERIISDTTSVVAEVAAIVPASSAVPLTLDSGRAPSSLSSKSPDSPTITGASSSIARSKYWGEPRTVELVREPGRSLGISIVGGRVEVSKGAPGTGTTVSGIFIKSVIAQSPAGRSGQLNMGDRILSVNGVDLKEATHEQAVDVIRNAANPVRFIVQSLHSIPLPSGSCPSSPFVKQPGSPKSYGESNEPQHPIEQSTKRASEGNVFVFNPPITAARTTEVAASEEIEEKGNIVRESEIQEYEVSTRMEPSVSIEPRADQLSVVSEERATVEGDDEIEKSECLDTFAVEALPTSGHGNLGRRPSEPIKSPSIPTGAHGVDRRHSAFEHSTVNPVALRQSYKRAETEGVYRGRVDSESAGALRKADDDSESEDEFGYTEKKMKSKYGDLKGELMMAEFEKGANGLGLSLAGHRDRSKLSVFVVGIQPESPAAISKKIVIGDELLEINGIVLHGRSHLNASAIIKNVKDSRVKLLLLRRPDAIDDMAVNPIQYNSSMQRWLSYSGVASPTSKSATQRPSAEENISKPAKAGMAPKQSITGALSVDLTYVSNDKKKESAERTASVDRSHGKLSSVSITTDQPTSPNSPALRQVKIHKGPSGFGITLTDGTTNDNIRGIFITHISPDSPTAQEKALKIGDQVLAVNGTPVSEMSSNKVAEMIQDNNEVELTVSSHTIVPLPHSPVPVARRATMLGAGDQAQLQRKASGAVSPNMATNHIVPGYETQLEIEKAGKGLGLSIVGGTDTVLGSVVIHEVYPDGAAAKDGRLQPGDQLLEVNGQSLRDVTHESAITILRQTPSKVRLLVYRDPNLQLSLLDPTQIYNIFEVELLKKPGKGLGLSIVGRKTEPGVFISEVVKGGVADADGRLMQGDQILAVNGQDLTNAMQEQAATILKTCMGKVSLKVGRWKLTGNNPNPSFPVSTILAPSGAISPTVPAISVHHAKPTLVTIEEPPSRASSNQISPRPSPSPPYSSQQQPFDILVSNVSGPGGITNGDHCTTTLIPSSTTGSSSPSLPRVANSSKDGRTTPEISIIKKETTPARILPEPSIGTTPTPSIITEDAKSSIPTLELSEEGCDTVIVEMQKVPDRPLGMGIGKRPRGILVTSVQPGTAAADKLKVGDRILAVNGQVVTDQQSAVNYVKSSGPRLALQLARPRPECMDLATGHVRSSLTTLKQVTLLRGPEGGFGFSIDGGVEEKGSSGDIGNDRPARTPIFICSITKGGPAALDGRIKIGDVILTVNGRSVQNASQADAVQLIKQSSPKVALMLMANPKQKRRNS